MQTIVICVETKLHILFSLLFIYFYKLSVNILMIMS